MSVLHELLAELAELAEQLGPPDEGMVAEAVEELTALRAEAELCEVNAAVDEDVVDLMGQYD